jgi:hypothetical protein
MRKRCPSYDDRVPAVRIQLVVYRNEFAAIHRTATALRACIRHARTHAELTSATVAVGDCSPTPNFDEQQIASLGDVLVDQAALTHRFFDANLGSAGGSNALAHEGDEPYVWVLNPDTYPSPTALTLLLRAINDNDNGKGVGACDARQLPIEHPKGYDLTTGEAGWLTGACMLVRRDAYWSVNGFDAEHFPLYCDDVDFSWRLRHAGWHLRTVPRATVFHDKRPGPDGRPFGSELEIESGSLAHLKLARRYCRPDVELRDLAAFDASGVPPHARAAAEFRRLDAAGTLPAPMPDAAGVGDVGVIYYGPHRFRYDQ